MKNVYVITSNSGGFHGVYSTEEKAQTAAEKIQNDLLAGGYSYSQVRVEKTAVK